MECQTDANIIDYEKIGLRIRKQRKEKGLTIDQLAEMIDVSSSYMGHIERGTRIASVETLARLCEALELDMHYVVFGCSSGYSARKMALLNELKEILNRY